MALGLVFLDIAFSARLTILKTRRFAWLHCTQLFCCKITVSFLINSNELISVRNSTIGHFSVSKKLGLTLIISIRRSPNACAHVCDRASCCFN